MTASARAFQRCAARAEGMPARTPRRASACTPPHDPQQRGIEHELTVDDVARFGELQAMHFDDLYPSDVDPSDKLRDKLRVLQVRLYLGVADGMSDSRVWSCRYSK